MGIAPADAAGSEQLLGVLAEIVAACRRAGIVPGILVGNPARARGYVETGFQAVTASLDIVVLESGSIRDLSIARGEAAGG
jgi:2-keto-3-deoxy-L-rhamnonate aldolase RhmA